MYFKKILCSKRYPYPSHGRFLVWTPLPPTPSENSNFASYFGFETPSPSKFPITFHGGGMGIFWNHTLLDLWTTVYIPLVLVRLMTENLFFFSSAAENTFGSTTVSNLKPSSNVFWLHTVFAIIYCVLMVIVLQHFTNMFAAESSDDSTKTIMITNIPKTVTSDLIKKHFW